MCDSLTDWGKVDDRVDKLLLIKLNKKDDELIMLECARSPHVAKFLRMNSLIKHFKSKQLRTPFIVLM